MDSNIITREVYFQNGVYKLEGKLFLPEGKTKFPSVIVCHPHPLYGGSMDNNVVNSVCEALLARSLAVFKFNFQGVGKSEGSFSVERERLGDVTAAINYFSCLPEIDKVRIGLAGYSAGAAWGLAAAYQDDRIKALAGISPPLSLFDFNILKTCHKPKLMIAGNNDEHISEKSFQDFCTGLVEPKRCEVIQGADHFWWGYEDTMAGNTADFFAEFL
jgi:uncharacterized protein